MTVPVPTVALLRRRRTPLVSPSGGRLTVRPWGRGFTVLDLDRWSTTDWPADAAAVLRHLGEDLAWVACYARPTRSVFVSGFHSSGVLYVPTAVADEVLAALWSADAGDLGPARTIAAVVAQHAATVRPPGPTAGKRLLAAAALAGIERDIGTEAAA